MEYLETDPIRLSEDHTVIEAIDQTQLPNKESIIRLRTAQEVYDAIKTLSVRGAPCIGICAAYGVYICARKAQDKDREEFFDCLEEDAELIKSARPTAVNLEWSVKRMMDKVREEKALSPTEIADVLYHEAVAVHEEDIATCRIISEFGLTLIHDGDSVITHCNAGALATSRYGTGLGPLLLGAERGCTFHAYVDETRPLLQGARLTAYELMNAGIDTTLMCDNMASYLMAQGGIDAVLVGCDRVARNGDTANKIGTSSLAVLAKHYSVPFYVFCPLSTVDLNCKSGKDIKIEERDGSELTELYFEKRIAPRGVRCLDPAFDITPAELISAIVTEKGILYPPYDLSAEFR